MRGPAATLRDFLATEGAAVLVTVSQARGSTPREAGAWMLVAPSRTFGTIGGGQLEYMAIDEARRRLQGAYSSPRGECKTLSIPLGPEIGQCCGGRVELELTLADGGLRAELLARDSAEESRRPHVYLFGGGHVGHALAEALKLLPVRTILVETREDALAEPPAGVETRLTPMPESLVREAAGGSAFVILTHDHALDFLIAAEALRRRDTPYVGMIGSSTKKAAFRSWAKANAPDIEPSHLVTPIGGAALRDKRPAVIAAMAAAEIMTALGEP